MAQIVCIKQETYKEGINKIGDIVAIHEDDVTLDGAGYLGFDIIKVEAMTAKEVQAKLVSEERTQKEYWKKGLDWYEIKVNPKYSFCVDVLTAEDLTKLESKDSFVDKGDVLLKLKDKISLEITNNETKLILQ